jgi:transposase
LFCFSFCFGGQQKTVNQITAEYGVHATQVTEWKKLATDGIAQAFAGGKKLMQDRQQEIDELHRQLGQVIAERDWLKKKSLSFH